MAQCPNCRKEVKPDERFCGNCGARLPQPPADLPAGKTPTGKETVILPPLTDPNLSPLPAREQSTVEPTVRLDTPPPAKPLVEPTMYAPPPGGMPGQVPSTAPPTKSGGGTVWKILAVIAGLGVLLCVVLAAGVWYVSRQVGAVAGNTFATANAVIEDGSFATAIAAISTSVPPEGSTGGDGIAGSVRYSESFDGPSDGVFSEQDNESATYALVDGAYRITVKQPNLIVWNSVPGSYGSSAIAVDTTVGAGQQAAAGLMFNYQDDNNFYIFTISHDGRYSLDVYQNDEPQSLIDWTESPVLNPPGQMNALRVETGGGRIRLYANDTMLDEISDATFANGEVALVVNSFDDAGANATFDNLVIRDIASE